MKKNIKFDNKKKAELSALAKENGTTIKAEIAKVRSAEKALRKENRTKKLQKKLLSALHPEDRSENRETMQQRFERIRDEKVAGLNQFVKLNTLSKKVETSKQIEDREKAILNPQKREEMLVAKRISRMAKRQNNDVKMSVQAAKNLKHWLESEKIRKAKKEEKRSKYAGKKEKVAPRPSIITDKVPVNRYIINMCNLEVPGRPYTDRVGGWHCTFDKLKSRLQQAYDKELKESSGFIGIYAYPEGNPNNCILEVTNPAFENASRIKQVEETAIAA